MELIDYKLGIDSKLLQLESWDDNRVLITSMAQQATQSIDIVSRLLDPHILNTPEFIDAIKKFITENRKSKMRIIVFDPPTIVKHGHRLVDMSGYFSSFIEIRKAGQQYKHYSEFLMIVDQVAFIHRLNWDRFEATANLNDRRQSVYYQKEFDPMWDTGVTDPNLRRVNL